MVKLLEMTRSRTRKGFRNIDGTMSPKGNSGWNRLVVACRIAYGSRGYFHPVFYPSRGIDRDGSLS
jgi:hypothetical protein